MKFTDDQKKFAEEYADEHAVRTDGGVGGEEIYDYDQIEQAVLKGIEYVYEHPYHLCVLTQEDANHIHIFDRCLTLEEKGLLTMIMICNKLRKQGHEVTVAELHNLTQLGAHLSELLEGLERRGYITIRDKTTKTVQL